MSRDMFEAVLWVCEWVVLTLLSHSKEKEATEGQGPVVLNTVLSCVMSKLWIFSLVGILL